MVPTSPPPTSLQGKIDYVSGTLPFWAGLRVLANPVHGYQRSNPFLASPNCRDLEKSTSVAYVDGTGAIDKTSSSGLAAKTSSAIAFVDGPRGVVVRGATTFPVSMARGATFDVELEQEIGIVFGKECTAVGGNAFGGICVNLLRHPFWGRAQETYGEDTYHVGAMGCAATIGCETRCAAVVKHFALNSMENARFHVNVSCEERALHEIYLRHFKRIICEGDATMVMASYNSVNGDYAGENDYLLNQTLKAAWKFEGLVMTDFCFGLRETVKAMNAGLDLEMPFQMNYARRLRNAVQFGLVPMSRLDDAVNRIYGTVLKQQKRANPPCTREVLGCQEHRNLARKCAQESFVLLKNQNETLPLDLSRIRKIALIGQGKVINIGHRGSSNTLPTHVITFAEGLQTAVGGHLDVELMVLDGTSKDEASIAAADVCIVVTGYSYAHEGEYVVPTLGMSELALIPFPRSFSDVGAIFSIIWSQLKNFIRPNDGAMGRGGDRSSMDLPKESEELISRVANWNRNVVVVVTAGSAFTCERWIASANALIVAWYPGQEGGSAMADVLLGVVNPSGKLPCTFPKSEWHLPFFDKDATEITYDFWHGYRKLAHDGEVPAFAFGFGLSYTNFVLSKVADEGEVRVVSVIDADLLKTKVTLFIDIENIGLVPGDEIVQVYFSVPASRVQRAPFDLVAFQRVRDMKPNDPARRIRFDIPVERLAYYDVDVHGFVVEPGKYVFRIGKSSNDVDALHEEVEVLTMA